MSERVSDKELQEMLDVMEECESYLPEEDIEAALRDLQDVRSGEALKNARERIAELEHERDEAIMREASLCDLANTWAREDGIEEATRQVEAKALIDRLWAKTSHRIAELERERDEARLVLDAARAVAESVGWRGSGPNNKDEFYCEVCSQHHEDFNLIPHRTEVGAECPIGTLRAAIVSFDAARAAGEEER